MSAEAWLTSGQARDMLEMLPDTHRSERKLRLFALECVRVVRPLLYDPRSLRALEFVEAHADQPFSGPPARNLRRRLRRVEVLAVEADTEAGAARRTAGQDPYCHPDEWNRINIRANATATARVLLVAIPFSAAILCADYAERLIAGAAMEPYRSGVADTSFRRALEGQQRLNVVWLHDIFGNPSRPVAFDPAWRTDTVVSLAKTLYESRDFSPMPILADALQDAGCENADVLNHCRDPQQVHVRGCWVIDLVLGKR